MSGLDCFGYGCGMLLMSGALFVMAAAYLLVRGKLEL